ncbi:MULTISPECIES: pilus assembly protein [unclassified Burkholderia]|uniref:pilus assembly protein n=1 Tax=unclassified Burkholderia TaxID=2613784 RepID=UPI001E48B39C|nr:MULTISPECIES: pilus assembly protein [unclassified Burkholderia]UEP28183.1 pilus assembly protein [Burkholderia sp. B21-007]UEP41685.1 pilus assembly protein [Burkholderia sp. B21-005]
MTVIVHRSVPGVAGSLGRVTRVSPATAHAVGCVVAFVSVLVGGIHLTDAGDLSGLARSRALLATAQVRAADTQRTLAAAQRRDPDPAAGRNVSSTRAPAWPALMLELADLAGASGLRIVSIEPQRADDAAPDGRRTVRIVADGGFPALLRLMGGLAGLPALVVPSVLHIERKPPTARVDMTIDVFPALPGVRFPDGTVPMLAGAPGDDPFGGAGSLTVADDAVPRLAGTIRDARAGLALFDAGDGGFATVARGEALGAARVMRVDAGAVTLATADGARRFVVDDGGRP